MTDAEIVALLGALFKIALFIVQVWAVLYVVGKFFDQYRRVKRIEALLVEIARDAGRGPR